MASNKVLKVFTANGTFTAPAGVTRVRAVATQANNPFFYSRGKLGVLALTQAGLLYGWGLNSQGEAGIGNQTPTSVPTLVVGPQAFQSIFGSFGGSSGSTSMFGLTKDGILLAWGATNTGGQLGVGDVTPRSSPTLVLGNGVPWAQVQSDNSSFTYGLTQAGVLYAWGFNTNGQLGDGTVAAKSSPVAVLGGLTFKQFVLPSISNSDACIVALTTAGAAYAWGLNSNGQLGVGDVTPRSSPVAVLGGLTFSQVVGAQVSFFGITSAGAAYAWGLNQNGQLGVGDVTPRSSPVAVLGGLAFSKILGNGGSGSAPVASNIVALTTAGAAYGWGVNTNGQLGDGTVTARSSPVAVLGGLTFSNIFATGSQDQGSCFGLTSAGVLYGWGANANGQLGLGDVTPRSSPVAVLGGLTFASLWTFSDNSVYGWTTDGQLYAWGLNASGQLGTNDVTPRSSPVLVFGGRRLGIYSTEIITDFAVVPGTAYAVTLTTFFATVGSVNVGPQVTSLTLEYTK